MLTRDLHQDPGMKICPDRTARKYRSRALVKGDNGFERAVLIIALVVVFITAVAPLLGAEEWVAKMLFGYLIQLYAPLLLGGPLALVAIMALAITAIVRIRRGKGLL